MDKAQMIQKAERELRQAVLEDEAAEAEVQRVQAVRAGTQAEVAKRQAILNWVHDLDDPEDRVTTPAPEPLPPADRPEPARAIGQSERVHQEIGRLGGSASNAEIREHLDLSPEQVRQAVKYLARRGKIVSDGYGRWRVATKGASSPYPPAAAPDIPAMNGAGRVPMI